MLKKKSTYFILILCLYINIKICLGQSENLDCEFFLKEIPVNLKQGIKGTNNNLNETDFQILFNCGKIDSIDIELLKTSILESYLFANLNKDSTTYLGIINKWNELRKGSTFQILLSKKNELDVKKRKFHLIEDKIISFYDFEQNLESIENVLILKNRIPEFRIFLDSIENLKMTYKEAIVRFHNRIKPFESFDGKSIQFNNLKNYNDLRNEINKPTLLYFTCHFCANSRIMEQNVLTDSKVIETIKSNYFYYSIFVDEFSFDEKKHEMVYSMNHSNMILQLEKYQSKTQPYFYILNSKGEKISEQQFTKSPLEFIRFLNNGLK